uniref:Bud22 domain-containing protein n=2 Tax=Ceratitis capitata TaxID=7213 RepID=W8BY36_CERCA
MENKCIDNNEKSTVENILHDRVDSIAELNLKASREVVAPEDNTTHVIDPFFITNSGESYRSSAVVVRNGKALNTEEYNPREDKKIVAGKYINTKDNYNSVNSKSKVNNKKIGRTAANSKVEKNMTANLHPSWAAKQKLKPVIGSFQGKKIKFDDEDKTSSNEEIKINNSKSDDVKSQVMSNKRDYFSESKAEVLHPSWAAKQKFKATITEFRGKKTTFGDEGDADHVGDVVKSLKGRDVSKNVTDGLHPSWLAKQKQKPAIASFQGKKIKFEDND